MLHAPLGAMTSPIFAFVQARMSSSRYPGKMLAPMLGQPMVRHVLDRAAEAVGGSNVVLLTSNDKTDDPLAVYAESSGYAVYRGALDDTVARFQGAARAHPCEGFFRVCGDSPLLDPALFRSARTRFVPGVDMVSNVHPRSYPKGHSVELVRTATYLAIDSVALTDEEREHATTHLLRHGDRFRIVNMRSPVDRSAEDGFCVDTLDDLRRLEALVQASGFPRALPPEAS